MTFPIQDCNSENLRDDRKVNIMVVLEKILVFSKDAPYGII